MTPAEIDALADRAADRAIARAFLTLGLDTSTPEGVIEAQRNFAFLNTARSAVRRAGMLLISVLVAGAAALFGVKMDLHL